MKLNQILTISALIPALAMSGQIIDHRHTVLKNIPLSAIQSAKDSLHIAYGFTSHGSQLLSANGEGSEKLNGLAGVQDVFVTSQTPQVGALHLFQGSGYGDTEKDNLMIGDAGWDNQSVPEKLNFVEQTRSFLGKANSKGRGSLRPEYNVVMWSWCGQVSWHGETTFDHYFSGMDSLKSEYPAIEFVLMTGHLDGTGINGQLHQRNERIRKHAQDNGYWLYDFADIDAHDPDGNSYLNRMGSDSTGYDSNEDGVIDSYWGIQWTAKHPKEVDETINAAHTIPLIGQMKTIAAWWMFAKMAGWNEGPTNVQSPLETKLSPPLPAYNATFDLLGRIIQQ